MTTYTSLLKKTGQTTSYVTGDDGDLEKGVAASYTVLNTGQYSGTTNVTMGGSTVAISNNCVQDNVTGLMWMKTVSPAGIGSNPYGKGAVGTMTWTTDGDGNGLFAYIAAVNSASLGGYSDWRPPNAKELYDLFDVETHCIPASFTLGATNHLWSSSSYSSGNAFKITDALGAVVGTDVAELYCVLLVRGDPAAPSGGGGKVGIKGC